MWGRVLRPDLVVTTPEGPYRSGLLAPSEFVFLESVDLPFALLDFSDLPDLAVDLPESSVDSPLLFGFSPASLVPPDVF